ncbi:serine protein kinase RIO [archaeon]|nr:serine protein kinase RIO [archaeon]
MTYTKKDTNDRKTVEGILDGLAVKTIEKLRQKGIFSELIGVVMEGKESVIILVTDKDDNKLILKVFKITASNFKNMQQYIMGDRRFSKIKPTKRSIVYTWCRKEYANLIRMHDVGVNIPKPYIFLDNMLVMNYIGDENLAPQLKNVKVENPQKMFDQVISEYELIYKKAGMVHGDLSQYNILVYDEKPVIIDVGQGVLKEQPNADGFLDRDIKNICNYFKKLGVKCDEEDIKKRITT